MVRRREAVQEHMTSTCIECLSLLSVFSSTTQSVDRVRLYSHTQPALALHRTNENVWWTDSTAVPTTAAPQYMPKVSFPVYPYSFLYKYYLLVSV